MNLKFGLICLISVILFSTTPKDAHYKFKEPLPHRITERIKKVFKTNDHYRLISSMVFGEKRYLKKKIKDNFKRAALLHLFTPSGLHLSSIFLFTFPLLFWLRKSKRDKTIFALVFIMTSPFFFMDGFYSIKRMLLLKYFFLIGRCFRIRAPIFESFLFIFAFDYTLGTFKDSPFSFICSFMFLGSIITGKDSKLDIIKNLSIAQLIFCFFNTQSFYPIQFLLGQFVTAIFPIVFVPTLINTATSLVSNLNFISPLMDFFINIVHLINELPLIEITPSLFSLILFFLLLQTKKKIFLFLLVFHTEELHNLTQRKFKLSKNCPRYSLETKHRESFEYSLKTYGYMGRSKSGDTCRLEILNGCYREICNFHNI